jgi:pilus assembly protein CpaC
MKKRCMLYTMTLLLLCLLAPVLPAAASDPLAVAVNQSRVLAVDGVQRVAVANPDIADVLVVSSNEILLIGKAPGFTTLQVWNRDGLLSYAVEVSDDNRPLALEIQSILGYPDIRVSKVNKSIILQGTVNDQYQKAQAEKVAAAYGERVVNLLEITRPTQVKIEVRVIELNREKTRNLGIKWGNNVNSPGVFGFGQSNPLNPVLGSGAATVLGGLGTYSAVNAQLEALVKDGAAKILSQPNIITLSGGKASIMVGGQIPVPISAQNGQVSIEWKDYGIKLDIEPEVNAEKLIQSKVKAEVSSLDWTSTHSILLGPGISIPPVKLRKAETAIALASGQTMAIGGLIASESSRDVYKIPLLGDLPILGQLFRSSSFNKGETELIILITPTIVDPAEYQAPITSDMRDFLKENPWQGGKTNDEGKNKSPNR